MRWPKIKKNGALAGITLFAAWIIVIFYIPASFFYTDILGATILYGGSLGLVATFEKENQWKEKGRYCTGIHFCLLCGFTFVMLLFLAFNDMNKSDMLKMIYCSLYYIGVVLLIYIIESILRYKKGKD